MWHMSWVSTPYTWFSLFHLNTVIPMQNASSPKPVGAHNPEVDQPTTNVLKRLKQDVLEPMARDTSIEDILASLTHYVSSASDAELDCTVFVHESEQVPTDGLTHEASSHQRMSWNTESTPSNHALQDAHPTRTRRHHAAPQRTDGHTLALPLRDRKQTHLGMLTLSAPENSIVSSETRMRAEVASLLGGIALERDHQQDLLRTLETDLAQTDVCSMAFLGQLNHELRTPLTSILGFTSLLEQEVSPSLRPFVDSIARNSNQLVAHIEAILLALSLKSDVERPRQEPTNVAVVLKEVLQHWIPQAASRGVAFNVEHPAELPLLLSDATWIRRILSELLRNAFAFTHAGGISLRIKQTATALRIEVEDTGIGISDTFLARVFEPYQQEEQGWSRTHGGLGLGLTIVERMVFKLGGTVRATSQKGIGSCFTVALPLHSQPSN